MKGQVLDLVTCRNNWGEQRAYYHDAAGTLRSIPLAWTSLAPVDPFVRLAAGRALFRVADLVELSRLLASLRGKREE
jgi:hypothetical protein